jgi:PAS domain S-box-containing protein
MAICNYYENLILNMPGNVYWLDANGLTAGCNKNVLKFFGLDSMDEFIGLSFEDQKRMAGWDDKTTNSFKEDTYQVLETGQAKEHVEEPPIKDPDGQLVYFLTTRVPIFNQKKKVITVVGISTDITELKNTQISLMQAKEAAEAANQAKTEFVQNMQHDIRTPCAGLWGVLDIVAKTEPDAERRETLEMAVAASKRLLDLCNEAVEFGDLGGNNKPVVQKSLDVRELARSVIELNKPAAFAKDLVINFHVATSVPPHIASDEFRLSRILINLLGNAVKFSHQGEITLSMMASAIDEDTRKGFLTIELKDQGIGIAADKVPTVFEKFSRGVASNTNKYPGTGLGLYVVKTFVDELNGEIELESRENEGTYFKINVPFKALLEELKKPGVKIDEHFKSSIKLEMTAAKQAPKATIQKKPLANAPFTHRLLIIEDDKTCLFAEKNLLSTFTSDIDAAESVAEALEKLATKKYDLVISDLGLPDGSGNDIVAKVKATPESPNKNTPFVAMTAHQDALKHQRAMEAGFTATNTKPLGADKATELLKSYPAENVSPPQEELVLSTKAHGLPVIDLALGMQRIAVHSEESAIEALDILWGTLQDDILLLRLAEENSDIEAINALLLKMRGALCYTGTPRLQAACEALFGKVGNNSQDVRKMQALFYVLYDEVKLFAEQFKELIKGMNAQKESGHLRMVNEKQKALLTQEEKFTKIANQVAHDIRSPLGTLLMTLKSCTDIPEARRITLREAAMGIGDIANHLLHEYRKKDADEKLAHEERQAVLVSTVLLESLTHKKYQYEGLPIQFDCNFEANTQFAFIKIQTSAFKRMLSNLMDNAVDAFDGQHGTVCLQLEVDNEWVKIRIQDTGKGMPIELINQILQKKAVTEGKQSGHGLGLTQVWETLDQNQGELEIDSKPSVGTTITVTFPRITAPHWIAEEIVLNANDTVVILDDDSSIHGAWDARLETLLNENAALQLKHFQLGNEALVFINSLTETQKERTFLLSDYELLKQEFNGLEVIAKSGLQRCMLVTSYYADPDVQKEAAKMGTKILPKQLASEVVIKMKEADDVEAGKVYAVVVDDNRTFVKALLLNAFEEDQITEAYYDPEHFLENATKYPKDTKIYLDNSYNTSSLTGLVVAKKLHELGYTCLYILSGEVSLKAPSYVTVIGKTDMKRLKNL